MLEMDACGGLAPRGRQRRTRAAFTLVELMVSILVLLAIIAATARIFGATSKVASHGVRIGFDKGRLDWIFMDVIHSPGPGKGSGFQLITSAP